MGWNGRLKVRRVRREALKHVDDAEGLKGGE
jgi:hypothetical protein